MDMQYKGYNMEDFQTVAFILSIFSSVKREDREKSACSLFLMQKKYIWELCMGSKNKSMYWTKTRFQK